MFAGFVLINTFLEYFFKDRIEASAAGFVLFNQPWQIDSAESAMAVYSVIQQCTCIVLVVKGGSCSDRLGRRPVLVVSMLVLALCIAPFGSVLICYPFAQLQAACFCVHITAHTPCSSTLSLLTAAHAVVDRYLTSFSAVVCLGAILGFANGMQSGVTNALIADMSDPANAGVFTTTAQHGSWWLVLSVTACLSLVGLTILRMPLRVCSARYESIVHGTRCVTNSANSRGWENAGCLCTAV